MGEGGCETFRRRLYRALEPRAREEPGLSLANKIVAGLIVLSVGLAVLESEDAVLASAPALFLAFEIGLGIAFLVEYALRVHASAEDPRYGPGIGGRLRYMASPVAILDLLATLPALLFLFGSEVFLLRLLRLLRLVRLAKLGRYSLALAAIGDALRDRRYELGASVAIAIVLLLVTSSLLYVVEGEVQPETFGSIPRAMWWSIATLTTVGYGDVVPITALGRGLAGVTALLGIGLVALPTGILAAAFSDALARRRAARTESGGGEA